MPGAVTWAEGALTPTFLGNGPMRGSVHSLYRRVVNLGFSLDHGPPWLLTVTGREVPQIPDSLRVPGEAFDALHALPPGIPVLWEKGVLSLPGITIACDAAPSTLQPWQPPRLTASRAEAFLRLNGALNAPNGFRALPKSMLIIIRQGLMAFIDAVLTGSGNTESLPLGLGGGSTPAGDDAMVGVLSGLERRSSLLTPAMLLRTTDISAKYLRCAEAGYFSSPVRAVWEDLSRSALEALAGIGGTSGADMLFGMDVLCRWHLAQNGKAQTLGRL